MLPVLDGCSRVYFVGCGWVFALVCAAIWASVARAGARAPARLLGSEELLQAS